MSGSEDRKSDTRTDTKYDKAVARARGVEQKPEPTELTIGSVPTGMLVPAADARAELAAKVAAGEWEAAPQLFTIPKGMTLTALLEGEGPGAEFVDEDTGVVRVVKTWILSRDGARVSILSSVQLDKKLPPFVGGMVSITRGEDVRNGSTLYTDYLVVGPKRADGKPRDWATKPALPAANTNTEQPK